MMVNLETLIQEQADKLGSHILDENPQQQENRTFNKSWLKWLLNIRDTDRAKSVENYFLHFVYEQFRDQFNEVLERCKTVADNYSIRALTTLMCPEKSEAVIKKLALNYNPQYFTDDVVIKEGIGNKLSEFLLTRYGINLETISGDSIDFADLLHAAFFSRFSEAAGAHKIIRILTEYLSSTQTQGKEAVSDSYVPPLDSIVAFFNSYEDKEIIENILIDIEKRRITEELASATKGYYNDFQKYISRFNAALQDVLQRLEKDEQESQFDGSKRILNQLITRYTRLKDFQLSSIREESNSNVFPRFYQLEAALDILDKKRFLVADDMGTGKTLVPVIVSEYLTQNEKREDFTTLVITTNTNKNSFKEKIASYLSVPEEKANDLVSVIEGWDRHRQYSALKDSRYIIINYELLRAKDWKLEDYDSWEVDEERYEQLKYEAKEKFKLYRNKGGQNSEKDFLKEQFRKNLSKELLSRIEDKDTDRLYDAYIKLKDIDESKTVVNSLKGHFSFNHVVIDKIQNAKNQSSLNSRCVLDITKEAEYVTCLSGTPFVNGLSDLGILMDVIGIYDALVENKEEKLKKLEERLGIKKHSDISKVSTEDRNRILTQRTELETLKKAIMRGDIRSILLENPRMIRDYLRPRMLHRKAKELLDVVDINFIPLMTELSGENMITLGMYHRQLYHILSYHDFHNAADQLRALQMFLLSGELYATKFQPSNGKSGTSLKPSLPHLFTKYLSNDESPKYKLLEDVIQRVLSDTKKKKKNILIFSNIYREGVTEYLQERLSGLCACLRIDGTITNKPNNPYRDDIIKRFNEATDPTLLIGMGPSLREGIDLHPKCSTVINIDLPFTDGHYAQEYKRVWRADQDENVDVYNLLVSNSLDIGKLLLILDKRRLGELLLSGSPPIKEELDILDFTGTKSDVKGFLDKYHEKKIKGAMRIIRDLDSAGAEKIRNILGVKGTQSEVYADAYILNLMSVVNQRKIFNDMVELRVLNIDRTKDLDGKVLDLAAGYGIFSHVTNIKTENLEINPYMTERGAVYSPSANYRQGIMQDVNNIYGNDRFRAAILSLGFHYASPEERGKLIYDIHKTLEGDGYLFLTESYKGSEKANGSIDTTGIKRLEEVLEYTGYSLIKSDIIESGGKRFYKAVAQKTGEGRLYDKPLVLRQFVDEKDENYDPDDILTNDIAEMYLPSDKEAIGEEPRFNFGKEFGHRFQEIFQEMMKNEPV